MNQVSITQYDEITQTHGPKWSPMGIGIRIVIVGLILFVISCIDFVSFSLNGNVLGAPFHWLILSLGYSSVMGIFAIRSRSAGWKLIAKMAVMYYSLVSFLTAIETMVFFPNVATQIIVSILVNGFISAFVLTTVAAIVFERMNEAGSVSDDLRFTAGEWLWKLVVIGFVYVLVYIASGALLFLPIAGDAALEIYSDLQMPDWILQFQILRGMLWAGVTVPLIHSFRGTVWETRGVVVLAYVAFSAATVLIPNELMASQLVLAHFIELLVGHCIIFGFLVVELFRKHHKFPLSKFLE